MISEHQDNVTIQVDIIHCSTSSKWGSYAKGPDGNIYEMRVWNFQPDVDIEAYAIYSML